MKGRVAGGVIAVAGLVAGHCLSTRWMPGILGGVASGLGVGALCISGSGESSFCRLLVS